jgi:hypothetical protein
VGGHEELIEVAMAQTGLDDFGEDSYLEGLKILARSLREEARLNAHGESVLRERILGHLKQRLQVEEWYRRHPEIGAVSIKAPVIGLGLPRTGSTVLSFLLAEDPNARSLRRWEASEPCPPPSTVTQPDLRIQQSTEADRQSNAKSHTPSNATGPIECQDLMALDFKSHIFQALAQIPSYSAWLLHADLSSTYRYERRVLKLLQWGYPAKAWRLKAPTHILYLRDLDESFPDARFVMTHRNPAEVIVSVAGVYADIIDRFTDHLDLRYIGKLNLEQWSIGMQRAIAFRNAGANARFYDIEFRAMNRDAIGEVRGLYRWLGEPVTPEFETGMARWWRHNTQTAERHARWDATAFGLESKQISTLFADYVECISKWTDRGGISRAD